jgi:hypothetical protein
MSTTEDTSAIDEKKAEESGTSTTEPDFKGFIGNYVYSIIFTIGISIFIIGGLGLYTTKVAQANILPDDIELAPYTIIDRIVNPISVDMNVMRPSFFSENKETLSQKAIFNSQEYLDSFNKSLLCSLKKSADPNSGLFANGSLYFSFVYENLIAKNFLAINTIFFYLSYLPESAIMFLYGLFGIFLWLGLYFFNVCISIFYHIINIPQLFRDVVENDKTMFGGEFQGSLAPDVSKPSSKWEAGEHISFFRLMKLILFFCIWSWIGAISTFVMPAFFTIYGLISPLFASYKLKQTPGKQDKSFNIFDFIKDTFAYKKFFFFILATLSLFSNGVKYLGNNAIVGIIFAVIFAYFMGLYTNEMPEYGSDGFSFKITQNIQQAKIVDNMIKNPILVQICQTIPMDDPKMEAIIKNGEYRTLTKPTEVGGNADNQDIQIPDNEQPNVLPIENIETDVSQSAPPFETDVSQSAPPFETDVSDLQPQTKIDPKLQSIQNELNEIEKQLQDSYYNVKNGQEALIHNDLETELKPKIQELKDEIQKLTTTQGTSQLGGRIKKYVKNNTKHNRK